MLLCDSSVINWDAIAALGTWVVGGAAIFVALKANAIAAGLKAAEDARSEKAARAIAVGLRVEIMTYGRAMKTLARRQEALANDSSADTDVPGHAIAAYEQMRLVELPDKAHMGALLPHLPQELANKVSTFHAVQRAADVTFVSNLNYWKEQRTLRAQHRPLWRKNLDESARELDRLTKKIDAIVDAVSDYLGLSAEERERVL